MRGLSLTKGVRSSLPLVVPYPVVAMSPASSLRPPQQGPGASATGALSSTGISEALNSLMAFLCFDGRKGCREMLCAGGEGNEERGGGADNEKKLRVIEMLTSR